MWITVLPNEVAGNGQNVDRLVSVHRRRQPLPGFLAKALFMRAAPSRCLPHRMSGILPRLLLRSPCPDVHLVQPVMDDNHQIRLDCLV